MPKILGGASGMHVVRAGFIALYYYTLCQPLKVHESDFNFLAFPNGVQLVPDLNIVNNQWRGKGHAVHESAAL